MESVKKILVPVDFSKSSSAVLDYAGRIAEKFGATIDVLHVWETPSYRWPDAAIGIEGEPPVTLAALVRSRASEDMDELLRVLEGRALPRIGKRFETGDARDAILRVAVDGRYDLVVMGTHGRRGLSHLVLGSVAEQVVRRSPCPVLTVREGATRGSTSPRFASAAG
jgi:universal stress protein A